MYERDLMQTLYHNMPNYNHLILTIIPLACKNHCNNFPSCKNNISHAIFIVSPNTLLRERSEEMIRYQKIFFCSIVRHPFPLANIQRGEATALE